MAMLFPREELRLPPQTPLPHPKSPKQVIAPSVGTETLKPGKRRRGNGAGASRGEQLLRLQPPVLPLGERGGGVLDRGGR